MAALKLQVTNAGRAALVNPPNTGTNAVLIREVGIATAPFTVDAKLTALPNETKRVSAVGGTITADDTMHVSIRDESNAVYDCYGFGLYLSDGTLFAVYSQPALLLGKAAAAMMLLAMDVVFADIDVQQITFGATNFTDPAATTEVPGIVELATEEEATGGTDKVRAITAWLLKKVLDARLGAAAPSGFVKDLLGLTTAALFRSALELKGAALKDDGEGKGLNADLLDGEHGSYYRQWNNLQGVPATASRWPRWSEVDQKPATFPPEGHSHSEDVKKAGDNMSGPLGLPSIRITGQGSEIAFDATVSRNGRVLMREYGDDSPVLDFVNAANSDWCNGRIRTAGKTLSLEAKLVYVTGDQAVQGGSTANAFASTSGYFISKAGSTVVGAEGAGTVYLRPGGVFSGSGEVAISTSGSMLLSPTVSGPGNGVKSLGCVVQGGFGGGFGLIDGQYNIGMWSDYGDLHFGMSTNNGTLEQRMRLNKSGALSTVGGYDWGSSLKLKDVLGALPYGLREVEQCSMLMGRYKSQYNSDGRVRLFFNAEQLLALMPETVDAEGVWFNGEFVPAIHLDQLLPVAFNAIKQLSAELRQLRADLADQLSTTP